MFCATQHCSYIEGGTGKEVGNFSSSVLCPLVCWMTITWYCTNSQTRKVLVSRI